MMWALTNTQRVALAAARNNPERAEFVKAADDAAAAYKAAYAKAEAHWDEQGRAIAAIIAADPSAYSTRMVRNEVDDGAVAITGPAVMRFPTSGYGGKRRVGESDSVKHGDTACVHAPDADGTAQVLFVRVDGSDWLVISLRLTDGREKGARADGWTATVFIEPEALRAAAAAADAEARARAQATT